MVQVYYTIRCMSVLYLLKDLMKKVTVEPGCIACGTCAFLAPQVFEVKTMSQVKPDADIKTNAPCIRAAARACPVQVITYEEE